MNPAPLQDIMKRMVRRDALLRSRLPQESKTKFLTSMAAFMSVDPLLSSLYKEYLDAKAYFIKLVARYGANDPMVAVAGDMADSAQSAFDTRMLEVRMDADLRRAAAKLMKQARRERSRIAKLYKKRLAAFYDRQAARERVRHRAADSHAATTMLYWMLWHALQSTRRSLTMAQDFSAASAASLETSRKAA